MNNRKNESYSQITKIRIKEFDSEKKSVPK